jgi:Acetyltransferase (GNAT) family
MTATTLALHCGADGRLLGAAALRWPATIRASGRLWGPVVHPAARGAGLGRKLLALDEVLATHPGVKVTTTEIPESRAAGWALFEGLGWRREPRSTLLARALPAGMPVPTSVPVRPVHPGEYLNVALAALISTFPTRAVPQHRPRHIRPVERRRPVHTQRSATRPDPARPRRCGTRLPVPTHHQGRTDRGAHR